MGGSSIMADAGRAMMLYRGLYDNTHTYEKLDVVNYNGSLYISTTDGNLGTEPTDVTKWKLFLQGGVSDNIQATDTYGLVGTKGDSSFVQLLLDSLASRIQGVTLNRQTLGYSKKNLFKNTATSTTENGVTFTVNDDGSVTVNGTATAQARLLFKSNLVFDEDTILSIKGTTNGGVSGWYSGGNVFGSEKTVPAGTSYGGFFIFVNAGVTVNNVTVYPMIRSAEITDGTYEPYVDDVDTRLQKIDDSILNVDTRLQKIDDSILNTLEEIDANTSEENIAGALALKKAIVKSTYLNLAALPTEQLDSESSIGGFDFVVPISVDYSGINGKILLTSLIHIGTDSTDANGGLSKSLLLAGMGGDGKEKIIKNILVYSKDYQTVRAKILVEYVEN